MRGLLERRLTECQQKVEAALDSWLPQEDELPPILHKAMRYVSLGGGKRLRPFLVLESCRVVGGDEEQALPAACAVELLHTYSLVHDDLPCMDDDDFRRGKPTCHRVFGEGIAVLCGDALLTMAFEWLATKLPERGVAPKIALQCVALLAEAAGSRWLVGGQALDISEQATDYAETSAEMMQLIHERKTAALIRASCQMGALIGGADEVAYQALGDYGYWLGIAFQITDDILDAVGDPEQLGKSVQKDKRLKKLSCPLILGVEKCRSLAQEATEKALSALTPLGSQADVLRELALFLLEREF